MFRIRRIFDEAFPVNREAVSQIQQILRDQFPLLSPVQIDKIPEMLRNPLKHRFKCIMYVAEDQRHQVKGFAILSHAPTMGFCFLDYIAARKNETGRGIGGAIYDRIREEALALKAVGIFFECLPDSPELAPDPVILKENEARLRFYERYDARPIINTLYETPVKPGDLYSPYLVFDCLGAPALPSAQKTRRIVQSILLRKYGDLCPPEYIKKVVASIKDDPIQLRPPIYNKKKKKTEVSHPPVGILNRIALVISDRHAIHHIHERGYVESPVRVSLITQELAKDPFFEKVPPQEFPERVLYDIHDREYVEYFKKVCTTLEPNKSVYPYVFPIRNQTRPPKELAVRAGYYCIDTFTPLNQNAFVAAQRAIDCSLTAAKCLQEGFRVAYALVRPPGHHAERRSFGGFCYFNNAAVAAHWLSQFGRVGILDLDYHHGNGQQQIFYNRSDVLTLSIHGHPKFAYPYFSGFEDETGEGPGLGFNQNFPLQETITSEDYHQAVKRALRRMALFQPSFLIVCLGLDTAKGDPTGTWSLVASDFNTIGKEIGMQPYPTLVVQEGGYRVRSIGQNARSFFRGVHEGEIGRTVPL